MTLPRTTEVQSIITHNLRAVELRIAQAAQRSGRNAQTIQLVVATKYVSATLAEAVINAGCQHLAESRPQSLWAKAEELAHRNPNWHLIGQLQRNKIRKTLPYVSLIHSVDSLKLLQAINLEASSLDQKVRVLLEVNISGDLNKHGFRPNEMPAVIEQLDRFQHLQVRGLMAMGSLEGNLTDARREFAAVRQLRDQLQQQSPPGVELSELSMGMSEDFEVAIEEGATIVRIGSLLFEGVDSLA